MSATTSRTDINVPSLVGSPRVGRFERAVPLRESKGPLGPFKATKIWNALVEHVKDNVELKRRRHKLRYIESCFTGTDAVDVVLHFLLNDKDTFSTELSREKALKVCQMLMHRKVFHSATEKLCSDKAVFEDSSSKLYQLTGEAAEVCNTDSEEASSSCDLTQNSEKLRLFNPLETADEPVSLEDEVQTRPLEDIITDETCSRKSGRKSVGRKSILKSTSVTSTRSVTDEDLKAVSTFHPTRTISGQEMEEVWRETALTQLLTQVELTFLDGILGEDTTGSKDHKSVSSARRQQQRQHLIISNLVARSWHLPLTPGLGNVIPGTSDPLLATAMECIEFLPNGESILNDPVFTRRGYGAKLWAKDIIIKHFQSLETSLLPQKYLELHMAILNQLLSDAVDNALSCLQLYMILLPVSAREELYRLLKFMRSLAIDTTVTLDPQISNEMAILTLLSDCIFQHKLLASNLARKLVQFLMNNVDSVFTVPRSLREKVAIRLYQLRTGKPLLSCESSFCNRVTTEEYERQSKACTENSLVDLMNSVLDDTNMSLKEKKHRLKQFQKSYPDLYQQHFDGML